MRPIHRSYSVTNARTDRSVSNDRSKRPSDHPKEETQRSKLVELISRFNNGSVKRSNSTPPNQGREKYTYIGLDGDTAGEKVKTSSAVKNMFSKRISQEIESVLKFDVSQKLPDVAKDCFRHGPVIKVPVGDLSFEEEPIYDIPKSCTVYGSHLDDFTYDKKLEEARRANSCPRSFTTSLISGSVARAKQVVHESEAKEFVSPTYVRPIRLVLPDEDVQGQSSTERQGRPRRRFSSRGSSSDGESYTSKEKETEQESFYDKLPSCRIEFSDFPKFPSVKLPSPVLANSSFPLLNVDNESEKASVQLRRSDDRDEEVLMKLKDVIAKLQTTSKETSKEIDSSKSKQEFDTQSEIGCRNPSVESSFESGIRYSSVEESRTSDTNWQQFKSDLCSVETPDAKSMYNVPDANHTESRSVRDHESAQNSFETDSLSKPAMQSFETDSLSKPGMHSFEIDSLSQPATVDELKNEVENNKAGFEDVVNAVAESKELDEYTPVYTAPTWVAVKSASSMAQASLDSSHQLTRSLQFPAVYSSVRNEKETPSPELSARVPGTFSTRATPSKPISADACEKEKSGGVIYAEIKKKSEYQSVEKSSVIRPPESKPHDSHKTVKPHDEVGSIQQVRAFWNSRAGRSPSATPGGLTRARSFSISNSTAKNNVILKDPDVVREFKEKVKRSSSLDGRYIGGKSKGLVIAPPKMFCDIKGSKQHIWEEEDKRKDEEKSISIVDSDRTDDSEDSKKENRKKRVVVRSDSFKVQELKRFWENAKKHNLSFVDKEPESELGSLESDPSCTEFVSALNGQLLVSRSSEIFAKDSHRKKNSVGSLTSGYSSGYDLSEIGTDSIDPEAEFACLEDELKEIDPNDLSFNFDDFEGASEKSPSPPPPLPPRSTLNSACPERPAKPKRFEQSLPKKPGSGNFDSLKFTPTLRRPPIFSLSGSASVKSGEATPSPFSTPGVSGDFSLDHLCLPQKGDVFFKSVKVEDDGSGAIFNDQISSLDIASVGGSASAKKMEIFFRAGALSKLETQRDDQITGKVIRLQACCRGYLARKRLERLKIEDTAVRCIQRNVRKLLGVREWPWWRLLVKLHPLMNVHRTEEELRSAVDELTTLRARVASLEKDKLDLKIISDKLEIKVSELTTDLAEEHSTAVLATERLEAETSERLKLEKDVKELQLKLNSMTQDHDRLEFEVLCSRASHLGANSAGSDDLDAETDAAIYKQKYERCSRDLEFMKEKLRNQHEDDLEQMVTLKKQLEKKLADAYEEVEEQRQVAAQWKRKAQRLGQEANDTKLLLEEQATRNAVLEKKQRKFDGDMQALQEEIRQDRSLKERLQREREMALAEKEQIERDLQSAHLELEMRGERLSALQREVEALSTDGKSDTEVATLRRAKLELENKVKDQEEELDDLAGQVQMLESAKVRLELQLENLRKDYKRELSSKDEEVEDVRCSAQKKVKAIEAQLEAEHEERTTLVREKHELERRLLEMTTLLSQSTNDEVVHKLKKELKKSKALLKDAQVQLEHAKSETPSKVLLRQLKNQLEDAEFARTAAVKGRQHAEQELQEMQIQYEELQKLRNDAEDKYLLASRERGNLQTQLDDLEAEMSEVMRKYKSTVQQLSIDQLTIQDQAAQITNLEQEKQALKESLAELNVKLENIEGDTVVTHTQKRLELKIKELESKAELELTSRQRLETQISRLKETVEKYAIDLENCRAKEQVAQDTVRRLQRQLRDLREELSGVSQRDTDASQKVRELEQAIDILEGENEALKRDLNIALRRIDDLQSAMQGDSESHESDAQLSDSDSDDSLATVDTLLSSRRPLPGSSQSQTSTSRRNQSRTPSPVAL